MYRSNQTDHSPPSIFHIVKSRHKSTSPAFEFELPSPQPSTNRYVRHLYRKTVPRYISDGRADGPHIYNLSSQSSCTGIATYESTKTTQKNNDQQNYYHQPHLSCSHLPSLHKHLPIRRPFGPFIMHSESPAITWISLEVHDQRDAFDREQSR